MMHGMGELQYQDGRNYRGHYWNDQKHGRGIFTWTSGKKYDGGWRNSKQHGEGRLISSSGHSNTGIWENGECVKWIDDEGKTLRSSKVASTFRERKNDRS